MFPLYPQPSAYEYLASPEFILLLFLALVIMVAIGILLVDWRKRRSLNRLLKAWKKSCSTADTGASALPDRPPAVRLIARSSRDATKEPQHQSRNLPPASGIR